MNKNIQKQFFDLIKFKRCLGLFLLVLSVGSFVLPVINDILSPQVALATHLDFVGPPAPAKLREFCVWDTPGPGSFDICTNILIPMMKAWIEFLGWLLSYVVLLFDYVINVSVVHFDILAGDFVVEGWKVIRDICNLMFIFILLWTAIKTILDIGGDTKKAIVAVILAAGLINFSALFTRVVIDSGNVMAVAFYNMAKGEKGLDVRIVNSINLVKNTGLVSKPDEAVDPKAGITDDSVKAFANSLSDLSVLQILMQGLGGTIFIVATIFLFIIVSVLLLKRILVLVFLIIVSPYPFLVYAFSGSASGGKWWTELVCQTFFPTIMFLLFGVSLKILDKGGETLAALNAANGATGSSLVGNVVFFVISIGMLYASVIVSTKLGCDGAEKLVGAVKGKLQTATTKAAGWAGRNTLGRGAAAVAETKLAKGAATYMPGGRMLYRGLDKVADAKFGTKKGFIGAKESAIKAKASFADRMTKDRRTGEKDKFGEKMQTAQKESLKKGGLVGRLAGVIPGGRWLAEKTPFIGGAIQTNVTAGDKVGKSKELKRDDLRKEKSDKEKERDVARKAGNEEGVKELDKEISDLNTQINDLTRAIDKESAEIGKQKSASPSSTGAKSSVSAAMTGAPNGKFRNGFPNVFDKNSRAEKIIPAVKAPSEKRPTEIPIKRAGLEDAELDRQTSAWNARAQTSRERESSARSAATSATPQPLPSNASTSSTPQPLPPSESNKNKPA